MPLEPPVEAKAIKPRPARKPAPVLYPTNKTVMQIF